jgi:hypothetical protein
VPRRDDAGVISASLAALATLAFSKLWLVVVLPMDARAAEHARIVASLRSTLDVAPAEQTLEREIRAERGAKAQRRAAASCIVQSALAAATATAIAAAVAAVPSTATTTSESGERVIGRMTGFFVY